jgi:hypothetical protein
LFFLGEVAAAHTHLAQGIALYDPQQEYPPKPGQLGVGQVP